VSKYTGAKLKDEIKIGKLYSVHYFEYPINFSYTGEKHDFWEIVYADKGNIEIVSEDKTFILKQGEMTFHKPDEWHNLSAYESIAPNVAIVSFECNSPAMKFFENKVLSVGQEQKSLISKIISEYTYGFKTPLDNPYTKILLRKNEQRFACEQLIRQHIAELLISLIRQQSSPDRISLQNINRDKHLFEALEKYMIEHISEKITISDLVKFSGSNKTTITTAFKNSADTGVIDYFITLKIDRAKQFLREGKYNISQISDILGYSSIHYFSRQFKKVTGMTPSEYLLSIQAIISEI